MPAAKGRPLLFVHGQPVRKLTGENILDQFMEGDLQTMIQHTIRQATQADLDCLLPLYRAGGGPARLPLGMKHTPMQPPCRRTWQRAGCSAPRTRRAG